MLCVLIFSTSKIFKDSRLVWFIEWPSSIGHSRGRGKLQVCVSLRDTNSPEPLCLGTEMGILPPFTVFTSMLRRLDAEEVGPFQGCPGMSTRPGAWTLNSPALMPISHKTLEKSFLSFWDSVWPPDHMSHKIKFRFLGLLLGTRTQSFVTAILIPFEFCL